MTTFVKLAMAILFKFRDFRTKPCFFHKLFITKNTHYITRLSENVPVSYPLHNKRKSNTQTNHAQSRRTKLNSLAKHLLYIMITHWRAVCTHTQTHTTRMNNTAQETHRTQAQTNKTRQTRHRRTSCVLCVCGVWVCALAFGLLTTIVMFVTFCMTVLSLCPG